MIQLQGFDADAFKRDYWQQKPGVFRQVLPKFQDPLSADELAGLALEPGVDSRVIQCDRGRWNLTHGPFDQYHTLGESHWTLLVQAVNEHFPPARPLLNAFRFLPDWRIDDLMVSFATPQGGVGPHLDQYDVFIVQGEGKRRWRIGLPGEFKTLTPHPELKQIPAFEAIIDEELEPGDMIYIPANHPHEGVSLEPSMNYSVGFRAPSQAELLSAFADQALDQNLFEQRFRDRVESLTAQHGKPAWHLPDEAIDEFQRLMQAAVADKTQFRHFIADFLSHNPRPPLQIWPEYELTEENIASWLAGCCSLGLVPGVRWVEQNGQLHIQGQRFSYDTALEQLLDVLKQEDWIEPDELLAYMQQSKQVTAFVLWATNEGLLVDAEEDEETDEDEA